jgi:hypothetical protein
MEYHEDPSSGRRSPGRDFNRRPPKHEAALMTDPPPYPTGDKAMLIPVIVPELVGTLFRISA